MRATGLDLCRRLPLFSGIPDTALAELCSLAGVTRYRRGAVVFTEGEAATVALLVLEGRLEAQVDTPSGWRSVGTITRGEVVGEQGLFVPGSRRNATVTAVDDVIALQLSPEVLLKGADNVALAHLETHLLGTLARRIRKTNHAIRLVWKERPLESKAPAEAEADTTIRGRLRRLWSGFGQGA